MTRFTRDENAARSVLYPTSGRAVKATTQPEETVDCPHCTKGRVTRTGSMWWQTNTLRCSYCQGIGKIIPSSPPETSEPSPRSGARLAEWPESMQASFDRAQGAEDE